MVFHLIYLMISHQDETYLYCLQKLVINLPFIIQRLRILLHDFLTLTTQNKYIQFLNKLYYCDRI